MDSHLLVFQIQSYSLTKKDIVFHWEENHAVQYAKDASSKLPEFIIDSDESVAKRQYEQTYLNTGTYSCLEVKFKVKRQVGFYLIQIYFTSLLLVDLSWFTFWIDPLNSPARVGLGIFVVLNLLTMWISENSSLPQVSYVKALDVWLFISIVFSFLALIEYAFVNVFLRRPDLSQKAVDFILRNTTHSTSCSLLAPEMKESFREDVEPSRNSNNRKKSQNQSQKASYNKRQHSTDYKTLRGRARQQYLNSKTYNRPHSSTNYDQQSYENLVKRSIDHKNPSNFTYFFKCKDDSENESSFDSTTSSNDSSDSELELEENVFTSTTKSEYLQNFKTGTQSRNLAVAGKQFGFNLPMPALEKVEAGQSASNFHSQLQQSSKSKSLKISKSDSTKFSKIANIPPEFMDTPDSVSYFLEGQSYPPNYRLNMPNEDFPQHFVENEEIKMTASEIIEPAFHSQSREQHEYENSLNARKTRLRSNAAKPSKHTRHTMEIPTSDDQVFKNKQSCDKTHSHPHLTHHLPHNKLDKNGDEKPKVNFIANRIDVMARALFPFSFLCFKLMYWYSYSQGCYVYIHM